MMEAPGGGEAVAIEPAQGLAPGVALRGMPSAVANAVFASAARRKGEGGARSELTERELAVLALVFDAKKLTQALKLLETPGALAASTLFATAAVGLYCGTFAFRSG